MIRIIPFAATHAEAVPALIVAIQREEFAVPITLEDQPDLHDIAGTYQRGAGNFWVALAGAADEVVGTVGLHDLGGGQAALRKMFVAAAWRGRGHGVADGLLDVLLARCTAQGVREVYLGTTACFLAAHRFYERRGFAEIPPADLPVRFPRTEVDTKFYRLGLPLPAAMITAITQA